VPSPRRQRSSKLVGVFVVVLLAAAGAYAALRHVAPSLLPGTSSSFCDARANGLVIPLATGQAGLASTIAGVAWQHAMTGRAVTVAYAAALQESKLTNLDYGDRDSVGVFQQRPSQGWGPARQLEDPVYATTKFFAALAGVPGYQRLPVYQAAQAVQHSAYGPAYQQYAQMAADMASAFTGRSPHAVWCWFSDPARKANLALAARQLRRAFGPLAVHAASDPSLEVHMPGTAAGWAVAAWLVSHADTYGIRGIRCDGYQWTLARGSLGWTRIRPGSRAPAIAEAIVLG
jgi:hypothetical protein